MCFYIASHCTHTHRGLALHWSLKRGKCFFDNDALFTQGVVIRDYDTDILLQAIWNLVISNPMRARLQHIYNKAAKTAAIPHTCWASQCLLNLSELDDYSTLFV